MTPLNSFRHQYSRKRVALVALVFTFIAAALAFSSRDVSSQGVRQPPQDIDKVAREYDRLTLTPRDLLKRARQEGRVTLTTSRGHFDLDVEPFDMRSEDYRSVAVGADGISRDLPRTPSRSFRGKVAGASDTYVRLVLDEGMFQGIIITPSEMYFVEPRRNFNAAAANSEFVFYAKSSLIQQNLGECGTTLAQRVDQRSTAKSNSPFAAAETTPAPLFAPKAETEIATEADFEFTSSHASAAAANADIQNVLTMVDGIYDASLGIKLKIVFQRAWMANNDPYTLTAASAALSQFKDEYDDTFAPGTVPARDLAHMFFGKDFDTDTIGIAYISALCNVPELSYGISQTNFDGINTAMARRATLTAHEIGHNFGASHPDEETSAPSGCNPSIMNSSLQTTNQFCDFSRNQITNHVAGTGGACLWRLTAPGCTYSLSETSRSFGVPGGNGSVAVTAGAGCTWGVAEGTSWLQTTQTAGSGLGTVNYTVAANTGGPRRAFVDIGGQRLSVLQAASPNCAVTGMSPGLPISASLATSDCLAGQPDREMARVDLYSFNGMAGQQIRLEMSDDPSAAPIVDTYVYLLAPDGLLIAENDDISLGVITNSRIPVPAGTFFTLPQTGTYTVIATSFSSDETGGYTLKLTSVPLMLTAQVTDSVGSAAALNSVTFARSSTPPANTAFSIIDNFNFSADHITRLILFTSDLGLPPQQNPSQAVLSVSAGGHPLVVENVGPFTFPGLNGTYIVVALKRTDGGAMPTGSLAFTVTAATLTSNVVTITIAP